MHPTGLLDAAPRLCNQLPMQRLPWFWLCTVALLSGCGEGETDSATHATTGGATTQVPTTAAESTGETDPTEADTTAGPTTSTGSDSDTGSETAQTTETTESTETTETTESTETTSSSDTEATTDDPTTDSAGTDSDTDMPIEDCHNEIDDDGDDAVDCEDPDCEFDEVCADVCVGDDCTPFDPLGPAQIICTGKFHPPAIATGDSVFAIGCMPDGSQNETPQVLFVDAEGNELASQNLLLSDGYYYTDIQLSYFDDRFQVLYQYNCDDNGSWNVGWGWGCIDFREYDSAGNELTPSTVFGEIGHNGHPVLDWHGNGFGVAWVSYDDIYFREIDAARNLVGGGGDKLANVLVYADPYQSDVRDGARTRLIWHGDGYAIATAMGNNTFFARINPAGMPVAPVAELPTALATSTANGQTDMLYHDQAYFLAYRHRNDNTLDLAKISQTGEWLGKVVVQNDPEVRYPALIEQDGILYVFAHDEQQHNRFYAFDSELNPVPEHDGAIDPMEVILFPALAYDPLAGHYAMAYQDAYPEGNVRFRLLSAL